MQKINRIYGIDLARSFAVLLFIIGHSITAYNNSLRMHNDYLQLLIRISPPTFIIVFGVFLELVYTRDLPVRGMPYVARRLWSRSIQCYVLYVVSCLVLALNEGYSGKYFLRMMLLAGATPYTDILKFYSIILLLAPLLIAIKQRHGLMPLVLFCLAVHVVHYLFYPLPYYHGFQGADIVFGFLYGATTVSAGPSVIHGVTFVVTGMWLEDCIRANMHRDRIIDLKDPRALLVLLLCIAGLALGSRQLPGDFISEFSSMELRNRNSYLFFLFGIAGAIFVIDGCMRLARTVGFDRIKPFLFLGRTSLFIFSFGNSILYITRTSGLEPSAAVMASYASMAAIVTLSWCFDYIQKRTSMPSVKAYHFLYKGYADALAAKLAGNLFAVKQCAVAQSA